MSSEFKQLEDNFHFKQHQSTLMSESSDKIETRSTSTVNSHQKTFDDEEEEKHFQKVVRAFLYYK